MNGKLNIVIVLIVMLIIITGCSAFFYSVEQVEVGENAAETALNYALSRVGRPYVRGGRGPNQFDCSGLIVWSYKKALGMDDIFEISGYTASDASISDIYHWNVRKLSLDNIKSGDIVFFSDSAGRIKHGGLFIRWIDDNTFEYVHVSYSRRQVIVATWPLDDSGREQSFAGAGRFKKIL